LHLKILSEEAVGDVVEDGGPINTNFAGRNPTFIMLADSHNPDEVAWKIHASICCHPPTEHAP